MISQKELKETFEKRTGELDTKIKNKETFTNKELIEITMWIGQAMLFIEIFKKTDIEIYSLLKKLRKDDIEISSNIKNIVPKFIKFLKKLSTITPIPEFIEKKNGSYWDKC